MRLTQTLSEQFAVDVPGLDEAWTIGLIVGPSGSGKTTIARQAFGGHLYCKRPWRTGRAIIDEMGDFTLDSITRVLTAVGFSSPPAWLKPYSVLSNGEQFRCNLARALLQGKDLIVFDEFTSLVDRTVARISSAACAKWIRSAGGGGPGVQGSGNERADTAHVAAIDRDPMSTLAWPRPLDGATAQTVASLPNPERRASRPRFVAVTCHEDVIDWLQPDWVVNMGTQTLTRSAIRPPAVELQITRCPRSTWEMFSRHHYLSGEIHGSARCFLGSVEGRPAAFTAVLPFPHPIRPGWREHRTVCLPDFQGIGIGNAMSEFVASLYRATGRPYFSTTSHPAMIAPPNPFAFLANDPQAKPGARRGSHEQRPVYETKR